MKKITLTILLLFIALSYAQVGINTETPDASAALDINSTNAGLLIPRLTQNQRDAVSNPATGLLIYQTDNSPGFYFYDATTWLSLDTSTGTQEEVVSANSAVITNSYSINNIEGLNDGDLVFNTSNHMLYIYMDPTMTTTDSYISFLNNNTTSSTSYSSNTSYIISFEVSKRIELQKREKSI